MCAFVTARIVFILPQTYLPLYLIDTLHMDKVGAHYFYPSGMMQITCLTNGHALLV